MPRAPTKRSAPKIVRQRATLPMHGGAMRFVLVADTHSQPHPEATQRIAAQKPDAILHAGDIGDLSVIAQLSEIAPTLAVRGNIDVHAPDLPDELAIDVPDGDAEGARRFKLLLMHIAVYGPKIRADAARHAREERASLIVCGHSHVPFIGRDRGLTVFNPGSIGPRRFQLPIVFGVMDVSSAGVALKHIDCETGERWLP